MFGQEEAWLSPPAHPELLPGQVHLWRVSLAPPSTTLELLEGLLSPQERERCHRFHREGDRRRSIVTRAALRRVLSLYLGEEPQRLHIRQGPSGKPFLAGPEQIAIPSRPVGAAAPPEAAPLEFNLSDSAEMALVAVSRERRVGVDIERLREVSGMEAVLERFFSEEEQQFVRSLGHEKRRRAFFALWTRKEAAAKALGWDLFSALARFSLPPAVPSPSGFLVRLPSEPAGGRWLVRDLAPAHGYAGAVCVEGEGAGFVFYRFAGWSQ